MKNIVFVVVVISLSMFALDCSSNMSAQERSEYAGQEQRAIKTLSDSDIEQLSNGRGWGLAKAAELNGFPGPIHVIEMKEKIKLSESQLVKIKRLHAEMKKEAVPLGVRLIELEKTLNDSFASKKIDETSLASQLENIAGVTKKLRYVHLAAHLKTVKVLSDEQIAAYNKLRGYDLKDPCTNIPEGHDPELWKQHNNCVSLTRKQGDNRN